MGVKMWSKAKVGVRVQVRAKMRSSMNEHAQTYRSGTASQPLRLHMGVGDPTDHVVHIWTGTIESIGTTLTVLNNIGKRIHAPQIPSPKTTSVTPASGPHAAIS